MTKCNGCIAGPTGVEGHQDLFVHTMSAGPMQFKCRTCGALWMRDTMKIPGWTDAVGNEAGAMVPQQAGSVSA
jgi:hypothetical protein